MGVLCYLTLSLFRGRFRSIGQTNLPIRDQPDDSVEVELGKNADPGR